MSYKWTLLGSSSVKVGNTAQLYYAVNKKANITVQIFDGKDNYLKTIVSDKTVGTNDQVAVWDLTDKTGNYVVNGTYRFTITATTGTGEKIIAHKYFTVTGNEPLSYKWTLLGTGSGKIGNTTSLYYAVNKSASITVQILDESNSLIRTIVTDKAVATNDQVVYWDLKDEAGYYVCLLYTSMGLP